MQESVQRYILDIMEDRRHGPVAAAIKCLLWVLSQLYRAAVWIRTRLYEAGLFPRHSPGCLTISVGNITLGGTGKTPVVEALARALSERGRKVAILSRGYKRKKATEGHYSPTIVSDGQRLLLDPVRAGDEPYLLARNLKGVAVLVDRNRVRAGLYAISRMEAQALILDDGFQYLPLGRRYDIVLIDCTNPFGNGHLLPRGTLREPLSALKRAHWFFLTKTGGRELEAIRAKLRKINPDAGIVETVHQPLYLEEVPSGRREGLEFIRGKAVYVVSAIARPEGFEAAIERLGGRIRKRIRFLDHHSFTRHEVRQILQEASGDNVHAVVTTEKDAVRLPPLKGSPTKLFFLRVTIKITRGAADFADYVSRAFYV